MLRRLGWIVASYFTRPLFLVFFGAGLLATVLVWFGGQPYTSYEANYPRAPLPRLVVDSKATLEAVRREGRQAEVDAINLNFLWADMTLPKVRSTAPEGPTENIDFRPPDAAFFRIVREFPNLRDAFVTFWGDMTGAEELAKIPRLEYLTIDGAFEPDFSRLGPMVKLRRLELTIHRPPRDFEPRKTFPNLETVVFRTRNAVTDEVLAKMPELPKLQTLVLDFYPSGVPQTGLTREGFEALARCESLKTLYVGGWMPQDRTELVAMARRALPSLDIRPSQVMSSLPVIVLAWPAIFLAMSVGWGLSGQFRSPLSRLAPGFAASHALVAGGFCTAIVAVGAARLVAAGYAWLPATIAIGALVAAAIYSASADTSLPSPQELSRRLAGNGIKLGIFLGVLATLSSGSLGDAVLRGERPGRLALLGLVTVGTVALAADGLRRLGKSSSGGSFVERESFQRRMLLQTQFAAGWWFAVARRERQIDAWASGQPRWTWWNRVAHWRAGNAPFRIVPFMLLMLGFMVGTLVVIWSRLALPGQAQWSLTFDRFRPQCLLIAGMMLLGASSRVASAWRARVLTLPLEVLRPYDRRAMQDEMSVAYVFDMVPGALVLAAFEAIGINLDATWRVDWARAPIDFLIFFVVTLCVTVGLGAILVVVKRDWLVGVLCLTTAFLTVCAVAGLTVMQFDSPTQMMRGITPQAVERQLWLPALLGVGLAWEMRRRWLAMEIGSRA